MFAIFRRIRFLYKKLKLQRLRYSLPFLVLIAYTVGGAYIFRYFELKEDEERRIRYRQNTEYAFKRTLNRMLEVHCENGLEDTDRALQNRHVKEHLFWLMDYLNLTQVIEERSESSPWTWMGAMFYAGQLYTTIGYGLPATQTSGGRLASIVYIMIGIPLFLIILAEVGKLLSRGLRKLYKKMHKMKRIPEAARKMSEPMKAIYHMTTSLASTAVGPIALQILNSNNNPMLEEEKLEAKRKAEIKALSKASKGEKKSFPIPWALTILIVWILFSAALFCIWENEWGYMTSVYFFFVSISTVGLGDLVPTKPDMMIVNFFMILIGLALLSMCVNLIQEALQKLIERLIEQYIDEIEKIAAVVTNNEINEFTEELEPFNVEINEMSLPIATLNIEQPKVVETGGIGRSVKDWFAERASSILLNKIYPISNSSSSDSEQEEEENINLSNLEEVIVKTEQAKARITINKHSFDENKIEDENLPQIEIHEGTPLRIEEIPKIKLEKAQIHNKGIIYGTPDSTPTREGISFQKRNKKPPKMPKDYAGALLKFSAPTMQAIRAIENSRLKTGQIGNDFKSRLFVKFATNQRFAEIVENNAPSPKKMVSSSIQTSPRQSPIRSLPQKSCQLRRLGCGIESMDSTSSDLNVTRTTTNDASDPSCSANDLDSLYSNTYFDVCFGNYHTDSVPSLMAITPSLLPQSSSQTAMANTIAKRLGERRSSLALKRRFSDKLFFGLFGKNKNILKQKPKFIVGGNAKLGRYDSDDDDNDSGLLNQNENQQHSRRKRRPLSQSFSSPSFPFINPQCLSPTDKNNKTTTTPASIPTTPIIHLTDMSINRKFKLGMIPSPSPAERISNFNQITKPSTSTENILMQGKRPRRNSRICGIGSNPLGCVPLHHRTLSTRRRFSAYASISPPLLNRWGENSDDEMKGKDEEEKEEEEEAKEEEKNQNLDEKRKENYKKQQISVETKSEENIIEELENNSDNNEKIKEITTKTNSENSKINEKEDKIGIKEQKE